VIRKKAGAINYLQYKVIAIRSQAIEDCNSFAFKHSRINLLCFSTSQIESLLFIMFVTRCIPIINKKNKKNIASPLATIDRLEIDRLKLILKTPNQINKNNK
jgi:hypothetical protein